MSDGVELIWHGWEAMRHALDHIEEALDKATEAGVKAAAEAVRDHTRASFDGAGSHPRRRSGALASSVSVDGPHKVGLGTYKAEVGPEGLAYIRVVELGKRGRRHRKPHPYLEPGYRAAAHEFNRIFAQHWKEAL